MKSNEIIKCPYDWDCGTKFGINEMYDSESEELKIAVKQKMTITFIHCPKCTRMFTFDTVAWCAKYTFEKKPKETNTNKS